MKFLDGWKTILGAVITVAFCLLGHGFSLAGLVGCIHDFFTAQTAVGIGVGVGLLGVAHKIEKARR